MITMTVMMTIRTFLNTNWGWIVVIASWILYLVMFGIMYCYGLLFIEFQTEFKSSATLTGWAGAIPIAFTILLAPPMQIIIDRYGHRPVAAVCLILSVSGVGLTSFAPNIYIVYVTYSLMYGGGAGSLLYISTSLLLVCFPSKNCVRALGLALSGSHTGMLTFAPLYELLFELCGWRNTLRIVGALYFTVGVLCVASFVPSSSVTAPSSLDHRQNGSKITVKHSSMNGNIDADCNGVPLYTSKQYIDKKYDPLLSIKGESCDQETNLLTVHTTKISSNPYKDFTTPELENVPKDETNKDVLKSSTPCQSRCETMKYPELWMISVAVVITGSLDCFLYINMVSYLMSVGFTESDGARFLSVMGASTVVGKLVLAFVGEFLPFPSYYLLVSAPLISCVIMGSLLVIRSLAAMLFLGVVIGGVMIPITGILIFTVSNSIFGPERSRYTYPVILFSNGCGFLLGSIIGQSIDRTGSYQIAIFASIGMYVIGTFLLVAVPIYQKIFAPERYLIHQLHRMTRSGVSTDYDGKEKCKIVHTFESSRTPIEITFERVTSV